MHDVFTKRGRRLLHKRRSVLVLHGGRKAAVRGIARMPGLRIWGAIKLAACSPIHLADMRNEKGFH